MYPSSAQTGCAGFENRCGACSSKAVLSFAPPITQAKYLLETGVA